VRKRLILRPTNAKAMAKLFGLETDNWTGKGITIAPGERCPPLGNSIASCAWRVLRRSRCRSR
jgi:hypothetical protein